MANVAQMFQAALMKGNPSIDKNRAQQVWNTVNSQADLSKEDPKQLVQMAYKISLAMTKQPKPGFADGGEVRGPDFNPNMPTELQQVTVRGNSNVSSVPPAINVPDSYLTPEQQAAQSGILDQNQAGLLKGNQNDPDLLRKAYADYQNYLNNTAGGRGVSNIVAGSVAGSSGGRSEVQNNANWKVADDRAAGMTIGLQKALMDQYKAGLDANKQILSDLRDNGQFQINASASKLAQTKAQTELIPILQDMNNRKTWSNPESAQSQAIQDTAAVTLSQMGYPLDFINKHIAGKSGVEIAAIMAGIVPNSVDLLKKAAEGRTAGATAAVGQATANTVVGDNGKLQTAPGQVTSISSGPVSITNPGQSVESTAAAEARTKAAKQFEIYDTVTKPAIQDTIKLLEKTYTGKGAAAKAALDPFSNDQAIVASQLMQVYQSYPEALDAGVGNTIKNQMNKPGWNGNPQLSLTPEQNITMLKKALLNVERIKARRSNQTEFENQGGRPTDFYKEPTANVSSTVTMTKDGKTFEIPADKADAAAKAGYSRK